MKIIVTSAGPDIDAQVDPRFGRAAWFVTVDTDTLLWEAHANEAANAAGGAGSQAAQFAAHQGVEAVLSGAYGPNAFLTLQAGGVRMALLGSCATVREAVTAFASGRLDEVTAPTSAGRHGGR